MDAQGLRLWGVRYGAWCLWVVVLALIRADLNPTVEDVLTLIFLPIPLMALLAGCHLFVAAIKLMLGLRRY
jgi:hypothetical protein